MWFPLKQLWWSWLSTEHHRWPFCLQRWHGIYHVCCSFPQQVHCLSLEFISVCPCLLHSPVFWIVTGSGYYVVSFTLCRSRASRLPSRPTSLRTCCCSSTASHWRICFLALSSVSSALSCRHCDSALSGIPTTNLSRIISDSITQLVTRLYRTIVYCSAVSPGMVLPSWPLSGALKLKEFGG